MSRSERDAPRLDLDALPRAVRRAIEAAVAGLPVTVVSGGCELGTLAFRPSVLSGVVIPAAHEPEPETVPREGVTVVATAMQLSDSARRRLADEFGSDYVVLDLQEAPRSTDVLLISPVSPQLLGTLRAQFPDARVIITEIEDEELGVRYGGPVSRLLDAGASAYVPPRSISAIASTVHNYLETSNAPALTAPQRTTAALPRGMRDDGFARDG
ncbi:hypothetical protein G9U51_02975 [Calidifontibacter sp. DB0510]|uniref:Uncharacterized protein n=1 Tax=Metallococcus carri TaxID=1656884 RepID=A0A967B010_9MICO|nr:hypothetical protein [Metallococcus carri]NHN54745.1 hypothetical protein [Metallococcus carri]NOP37090.1 hypothetical protein [Calidifontibacter sp. DB2511S]